VLRKKSAADFKQAIELPENNTYIDLQTEEVAVIIEQFL
jgi:hypothetical protein